MHFALTGCKPERMKMSVAKNEKVTERVDNVREIFMVVNASAISHTKNVDTRYKYVNEYVEDGIMEIVFVKSA